jgi:hypothetical protein
MAEWSRSVDALTPIPSAEAVVCPFVHLGRIGGCREWTIWLIDGQIERPKEMIETYSRSRLYEASSFQTVSESSPEMYFDWARLFQPETLGDFWRSLAARIGDMTERWCS